MRISTLLVGSVISLLCHTLVRLYRQGLRPRGNAKTSAIMRMGEAFCPYRTAISHAGESALMPAVAASVVMQAIA
jgi:hypothetical protein